MRQIKVHNKASTFKNQQLILEALRRQTKPITFWRLHMEAFSLKKENVVLYRTTRDFILVHGTTEKFVKITQGIDQKHQPCPFVQLIEDVELVNTSQVDK